MYKWLIFALLTGTCTTALAHNEDKTVSQVKPESVEVSTTEQDGKLILGEKEWIYVKDLNRNLRARIDTGATTSSISADVIDIKREKGKRSQVTFRLKHDDWEGDEMTLPVERWVEVRQSSTEKLDKRPVIKLPIKLGGQTFDTEFSLVDRSHLSYAILIGRSLIDERAVVDVSHKYIQKKNKVIKEKSDEKDAEAKVAKADDDKSDDKKDESKDSDKKSDESKDKEES
ncbi:MAG: ATP-dependent zinc protease [Vibrio sp.]